MKQNWDKKPSGKKARILSSTFIVTGLFCFLLYTWNDYTESVSIFQKNNSITQQQQDDSHSSDLVHQQQDNILKITTTTATETIAHITTTIKPTTMTNIVTSMSHFNEEEVHQNSIRVEEQISSMRKEIAATNTITSYALSPQTTTKYPTYSLLSDLTTTKNDESSFNPMKNLVQILNTSPVVLFINSKDEQFQTGNLLKKILLNNYQISPEPIIVDLNKHENGLLLQNYIKEYKLNRNDNAKLPYLFINSRSVLDNDFKDNLLKYHDSGELLNRFKNFAEGKVRFDKLELPSNS